METFIKEYSNEKSCLLAFIFGSIAKGNSIPNDCDLFWVTGEMPNSQEWNLMKKMLLKMKEEFYKKFKIRLNICVNTLDEFYEGSEFKQRIIERPKIVIKNGIQHAV